MVQTDLFGSQISAYAQYSTQVLPSLQLLLSWLLNRDLKSANVFLTSKGQVRVGDLGLARKTKRTAKLTKCGTDVYMAPEMIAGAPYGKKADVWSLGCILFEMMTGVFMSVGPQVRHCLVDSLCTGTPRYIRCTSHPESRRFHCTFD